MGLEVQHFQVGKCIAMAVAAGDGGLGPLSVRLQPRRRTRGEGEEYWAPLTCQRHILPHPAQPQQTNHWASANAETTPAGAPAAAADRTQRPDATCEGKNG